MNKPTFTHAFAECCLSCAIFENQEFLLGGAAPTEAWLDQVGQWEEWRAANLGEEDCWPPTLSSLVAASQPEPEVE